MNARILQTTVPKNPPVSWALTQECGTLCVHGSFGPPFKKGALGPIFKRGLGLISGAHPHKNKMAVSINLRSPLKGDLELLLTGTTGFWKFSHVLSAPF